LPCRLLQYSPPRSWWSVFLCWATDLFATNFRSPLCVFSPILSIDILFFSFFHAVRNPAALRCRPFTDTTLSFFFSRTPLFSLEPFRHKNPPDTILTPPPPLTLFLFFWGRGKRFFLPLSCPAWFVVPPLVIVLRFSANLVCGIRTFSNFFFLTTPPLGSALPGPGL